MCPVIDIRALCDAQTVGNPSQIVQKHAECELSVFSNGEKYAKCHSGVNFSGYRFLNIGKYPKPLNRRLPCPVLQKLLSLLASLPSYLHVQLSKKSQHHMLRQLFLSQYLTKCNIVWGQNLSAPDTPPSNLGALLLLFSDRAVRLYDGFNSLVYSLWTTHQYLRSKLCLNQLLQQAFVSDWFLLWGRVPSKKNKYAFSPNRSSINSVQLSAVPMGQLQVMTVMPSVMGVLIRSILAYCQMKSPKSALQEVTGHIRYLRAWSMTGMTAIRAAACINPSQIGITDGLCTSGLFYWGQM